MRKLVSFAYFIPTGVVYFCIFFPFPKDKIVFQMARVFLAEGYAYTIYCLQRMICGHFKSCVSSPVTIT